MENSNIPLDLKIGLGNYLVKEIAELKEKINKCDSKIESEKINKQIEGAKDLLKKWIEL